MATKGKVEVFSAGCTTCKEAVETVKRAACSSCEVIVLDMNDSGAAKRAKALGVRSVPAVAIDGKLAAMLTIGKLAALADVRADTLRYYERQGLIAPAGKARYTHHPAAGCAS